MQHEHYTHTAPDIPSSTALSIFFFLLHFLLMQLLFFLLVPFQDFLHSLLSSRPILRKRVKHIILDHTAVKSLYFVSVHPMQKQQELDICLPPDVYIKTHNYSLAGSNPAYLYPVLYTGLRPFRFYSLLCLNQRPALALSLELYHVGKNAALMQQLCRRSLFCY